MDLVDKCFYIRIILFLLNIPIMYYLISVVGYKFGKFLETSEDKLDRLMYNNDKRITRSITWIGSCLILMAAQIIFWYLIYKNDYYCYISEETKNIIDFVILMLVIGFFLPLNFIMINSFSVLDWSSYKKVKINKWLLSYSSNSLYLLVLTVSIFKDQ